MACVVWGVCVVYSVWCVMWVCGVCGDVHECTHLHEHARACEYVSSTLSGGIGTELRKHMSFTNLTQNKRRKAHRLIHSSQNRWQRFWYISFWHIHRRKSTRKTRIAGPMMHHLFVHLIPIHTSPTLGTLRCACTAGYTVKNHGDRDPAFKEHAVSGERKLTTVQPGKCFGRGSTGNSLAPFALIPLPGLASTWLQDSFLLLKPTSLKSGSALGCLEESSGKERDAGPLLQGKPEQLSTDWALSFLQGMAKRETQKTTWPNCLLKYSDRLHHQMVKFLLCHSSII